MDTASALPDLALALHTQAIAEVGTDPSRALELLREALAAAARASQEYATDARLESLIGLLSLHVRRQEGLLGLPTDGPEGPDAVRLLRAVAQAFPSSAVAQRRLATALALSDDPQDGSEAQTLVRIGGSV